MIEVKALDMKILGESLTMLVALDANLPVGHVEMRHHRHRVAGFKWLFVRKEYRGRGVGTALMKECEAIARLSGCVKIEASIDLGNENVVPFYHRLGFTSPVDRSEVTKSLRAG